MTFNPSPVPQNNLTQLLLGINQGGADSSLSLTVIDDYQAPAPDSLTVIDNSILIGKLTPPYQYNDVLPALTFTNSTNVVTCTYTTALDNLTALTCEAWVYCTSLPTAGNVSYVLDRSNDNTVGFWLYLQSSGAVTLGVCNGTTNAQLGGGTLTTGAWHHVAGSYDGAQLRVFLDGVLAGTQAQAGFITGTDAGRALLLGNKTTGTQALTGTLACPRVSTICRYTSTFTPSAIPFIPDSYTGALYLLAENAGTTTADWGPNQRNGTLAGATLPLWTANGIVAHARWGYAQWA